jgi:hypothetical protein
MSSTQLTLCPSKTSDPIIYHSNNPVMISITKSRMIPIYIIWYGTWNSLKKTIIRDFINNLSNSDWLNIQTTYFQQITSFSSKQYVSANIKRMNETIDNYSQGKSINDTSLQLIISR